MPKTNLKQKILFLTFFALASFALTQSANAATYYVDGSLSADCTSGNYSIANRACNGSSGNAYNTITDVNSRLQSGDTAIIRAGTYAQQIAPANNGSSETARIIYAAYVPNGGTRETVNITYYNSGSPQANLESKSWITLFGLRFQDAGNRWIMAQSATHIIVDSCTFVNAGSYSGMSIRYASYCTIRNCDFAAGDGLASDGVSGRPSDLLSMYNAHHNLVEGNAFDKAQHYCINIHYKNASHNIVRNNTFNNIWHAAVGVYETNVGDKNLIENNIIKNSGADYLNSPRSEFESYDQRSIQIGVNAHYNIVRRNILYNNGSFSIGAGSSGTGMYNKVYNNTFDQEEHSIRWPAPSDSMEYSHNIFKNNSITRAVNYGVYIYIYSQNTARDINYWINNNFYGNPNNRYKTTTSNDTLSGFESAWPNEFDGNINVSPGFTNADARIYSLQSTSPMIDAGAWLTTITSATGNGANFTVADAGYFTDGWGIVTGDTIKLQNDQERTITTVNYTTNQITVNSSVSWTQGMGVALDYEGARPDIGAKEYASGGSDTTPPAKPSGLAVE